MLENRGILQENFLYRKISGNSNFAIISLGKIRAFSGNWYMIQSDLPWLISSRIWISRILFSCDQAALWMVQSVRLSVCPSLLFHYVPIIVSSWNFQELLPTSNGSWCMGIKGEMSGTVCVTFTWDMYTNIYIYIWVAYSLCFFCCLFITVTWWYVWCFEWASGNQEEVQACLVKAYGYLSYHATVYAKPL